MIVSFYSFHETYVSFFICCQFDASRLRKLRPSFKQSGGSVTAGNASSIRFGYSMPSSACEHLILLNFLRGCSGEGPMIIFLARHLLG